MTFSALIILLKALRTWRRDVEDEDMESVEEFDESLDRFEPSGWRPMRLCTSYYSGGCARGWECTFAHDKQELHPRALS